MRWILLGLLLLLAAVAFLLLRAYPPPMNLPPEKLCAANLRGLWQMQLIYMTKYGGSKSLPQGTETAFWAPLTQSSPSLPPLIGPDSMEIFRCPLREAPAPGFSDYVGPLARLRDLKDTDAVAWDHPDNHPDSGNVLLRSGVVKRFEGEDWKHFLEVHRP